MKTIDLAKELNTNLIMSRDRVLKIVDKIGAGDSIDLKDTGFISSSAAHELLKVAKEHSAKLINVSLELKEIFDKEIKMREMDESYSKLY